MSWYLNYQAILHSGLIFFLHIQSIKTTAQRQG
jgi:hypothetical protein